MSLPSPGRPLGQKVDIVRAIARSAVEYIRIPPTGPLLAPYVSRFLDDSATRVGSSWRSIGVSCPGVRYAGAQNRLREGNRHRVTISPAFNRRMLRPVTRARSGALQPQLCGCETRCASASPSVGFGVVRAAAEGRAGELIALTTRHSVQAGLNERCRRGPRTGSPTIG